MYDRQILEILAEAGNGGISVQSVARHVYNRNCTFFSQPDYAELHSYVQQYLLRNSVRQESLVERTDRRGYYRLNTERSADARQLMLQFKESREEDDDADGEQPAANGQDLSLCLFD